MTTTSLSTSIWVEVLDTPFRLSFVDAGGIRTRVLDAGSGQPLILLHGTGGHLEAFAYNIAELSHYFRVIVYDMIGHGFTDKPDYPYTVDVLANHLVALLDALSIEKAHLSGESLGGWVAAWTGAYSPARVDRLILNTPGNITNKVEVMRQIAASTRRAVHEVSYETVRARLEWLFYDKSLVTDELVETRVRIYRQPGFDRAVEHIVALQDPEIRQRYTWNEAWCSRISAPTLLLWTDHDPTGTFEEARLLQSWIRGSQLELIANAGHWPQWEQAEAFNTVHRRFLLA
jgi:2-hydroxy-6-oxonona-2,4-dienedioate hydrolase